MDTETFIPDKRVTSDRLDEIRNIMLNSSLIVLSILLVVFLPISFYRSIQAGTFSINYWHIMVALIIWLITFFRYRIPLKVKIILFLGSLGVTGFIGILTWGLIGQGAYLLLFICVFSSILTRGYWAISAVILCLLGLIVIAVGVYSGAITYDFDFDVYALRSSSWLTYIVGFAFVSLGIVVALNKFHYFLKDAVENLEEHVHKRTIELETANQALLLSGTVFRNTTEGIMITNAEKKVISVNNAFIEITGFTEEEAKGQNPSILKSGQQDEEFYKNFWQTLLSEDQWKGVFWNKNKYGKIYPQESSVNVVKNEEGTIVNYVAVFSDITERIQSEEKIEHMAKHDGLTGLPNRVLFQDRLSVAINSAHRNKDRLAIMFIDLDGFKSVNDNLGHEAGDSVLKEVARRLRSAVRESDTVSRFGGDEFVLLLSGVHDKNGIAKIAEKILASLSKPIPVKTGEANIGSSIGIAIYPDHGEATEELLKEADAVMYTVKKSGKNNFEFAASR